MRIILFAALLLVSCFASLSQQHDTVADKQHIEPSPSPHDHHLANVSLNKESGDTTNSQQASHQIDSDAREVALQDNKRTSATHADLASHDSSLTTESSLGASKHSSLPREISTSVAPSLIEHAATQFDNVLDIVNRAFEHSEFVENESNSTLTLRLPLHSDTDPTAALPNPASQISDGSDHDHWNGTPTTASGQKHQGNSSGEADQGMPVFLFSILAEDELHEMRNKSSHTPVNDSHSKSSKIVDPFHDSEADFRFTDMPLYENTERGQGENDGQSKQRWIKSGPLDDAQSSSFAQEKNDTATHISAHQEPAIPTSFARRAYDALYQMCSYIRCFFAYFANMLSDQVSLHIIVRNVLAFAAAASVLVVYIGFMYCAVNLPVFAFAVFEDSLKNFAPVVKSLFLSVYVMMTVVYVTAHGKLIRYYADAVSQSHTMSLSRAFMLASFSICLRLFSSPIVIVPFLLPFSFLFGLLARAIQPTSARGLSLKAILASYRKTSGIWAFEMAYKLSLSSFILVPVSTLLGNVKRNELYDIRDEL